MTELTKQQTGVTVATEEKISREKILKYLESMGMNLPPQQAEQFIEIAQAHNLNPFKREIYGIPYGQNFNIIVGYEVYLKRADKTKTLDGWTVTTEGEGMDMVAKITIWRKDRERPFEWEVDAREYHAGNSMWKNKTKTMLKKVVIAQGFRLCFPNDFDGMPYLQEEIMAEGTTTQEKPLVVDVEPQAEDKADEALLLKVKALIEEPELGDTARAEWVQRLADAEKSGITVGQAEKAIVNLNRIIERNRKKAKEQAEETAKQSQAPKEYGPGGICPPEQRTDAEVPQTDENPQEPVETPQTPLDGARKRMHALGTELYGPDKWNTVRKDMVKAISKAAESSKDLSLEGIEHIISQLEAAKLV